MSWLKADTPRAHDRGPQSLRPAPGPACLCFPRRHRLCPALRICSVFNRAGLSGAQGQEQQQQGPLRGGGRALTSSHRVPGAPGRGGTALTSSHMVPGAPRRGGTASHRVPGPPGTLHVLCQESSQKPASHAELSSTCPGASDVCQRCRLGGTPHSAPSPSQGQIPLCPVCPVHGVVNTRVCHVPCTWVLCTGLHQGPPLHTEQGSGAAWVGAEQGWLTGAVEPS